MIYTPHCYLYELPFQTLINYYSNHLRVSLETLSGRPQRSAVPLSIMSLRREVNPSKLEAEEDRYEELAAEGHMQKTIGEMPAAKDYVVTTTLHYCSVGDIQQGLLDCLQDAARDIGTQGEGQEHCHGHRGHHQCQHPGGHRHHQGHKH